VKLIQIDPDRPDVTLLMEAAEVVLRGGVIGYPTDTLYGLGCALFDVAAVEMVARVKRRDPSLAVISLIPDASQVYGLASDVPEVAERLMARFWPGPLSLIFRASSVVPARVRGAGDTVALRLPRDPLCERLLEHIGGPLVSSSANLSGQRPAETAEEVVRIFGNQLDLVIDSGPRRQASSTLVDLSGRRPRLLRQGPIDVRGELGDFEDTTIEGGR
jgi:L-threonylcarbamoyladenylate synthase